MKILLTLHSLVEFAGSELNSISITKELKKRGFEVEIATFNYDFPIKKICEENGLVVKKILIEELENERYDLIWAHHSPVLNYLLFEKKIIAEKIIFSCLSPFEPLETPPAYVNQLNFCLANSYETRDKLLEEGVLKSKILYFPNYSSREFLEFNEERARNILKSLCIVSNHVPQEIIEAVELLRANDVNVDIIGINHIAKEVTPKLLSQYDAVITIGKTVQYCMSMAIPVYCYDIHGGPGWINLSNYKQASYYNFSGRSFDRFLTGREITEEVLTGFKSATEDIKSIKNLANQEFSLDVNLTEIIRQVESSSVVNISDINANTIGLIRMNQAFVREYEYKRHYKNESLIKERNIEDMGGKIETLKKREAELMNHIKEYEEKIAQMDTFCVEIDNKYNLLMEKYQKISNEYDELQQINKDNMDRILQLEKNCEYMNQLVNEKNSIITIMENTKLWKTAEILRKGKIKLRKVLKNPSLLIKKIRKQNTDFSPKVILAPAFQTDVNCSELPLVSVVIPIYDRTDVLVESIESILNQSYPNIELILVCDGSPEETLKIVNSYESHPKVRAFYFKNNSGNAVRGRNKAIKEARGKYLAFQDSDDVAVKNRIQISVEYAEKYNSDVVYGGWRAILDGSRKIELENNQEVFSPECDYELLKKICVPCQSTVMVKLEVVRKIGGLKTIMKYREDHELWLRLAYYKYRFKAVPEILTNLRLHSNNLELTFKDNDPYWENLTLKEHKIIRPLKPKIAYVVAGCGISGGLAVICNHANGLLDRGYDVLIITEDQSTSIDWFPNQRVPIVSIKEVPNNIDILIATYWTTAYTIENIPAMKKFYFIQSDESKFFNEGSKESKAAKDTYFKDYEFITMAKWLQDMLLKEYNKKALYVPNGVDLNIIHKVEPLEKSNGKIRILLEGPIDAPFKGMKQAFEVVNDLDCEVWCVSTSGKPQIGWKCDRFFENVPMDKMKHIYSSCEILLKMSTVESFCLPALEMMACGGVCVLNRFTGLEEFVIDGYNGLVVDLGDIKGAKEAIKKLIENEELRQRISENSIKTASNWSWSRSIDELENIYYPSAALVEEE